MKRIFATIVICCLSIYSLMCQTFESAMPTSPKAETRAVWLTTYNSLDWPKNKATSSNGRIEQQKEFCEILDRLKAININTILLQTRVRGTTIYPSAIETWDGSLTGTIGQNPGYDPLEFAINECHKRGMELHAWVVTVPCFKISVAKRMGKKSVLRKHPNICIKHNDSWYLDPGHPQTATYLASICKEITQNYDIDGIHLDYIRYPENAKRFRDNASYQKYGKRQKKDVWRRNNITHCVRTIYNTVKAIKPWVKISSSPVGKHEDLTHYSSYNWNAYSAVYQDAQGWLREGIHDMLFPMMYFQGNHFYPFAIDWKENESDGYVAPGLGVYFLSPKEKDWSLETIGRELQFIRSIGLGGQAFFRYQFINDNHKGIYDYLKDVFYPYPALPLPCNRIDSIPPNAPQKLRIQQTGNETRLCWEPSSDNVKEGGVKYNVYASTTVPTNIDLAQNLVAINLDSCHFTINGLHCYAHGLNFAVTTIDRSGNESAPAQISTSTRESAKNKKDFLWHDGNVLLLPEQDYPYVVITDLYGHIVDTGTYSRDFNISSLPKGVYEAKTLGKKGRTVHIGYFIK